MPRTRTHLGRDVEAQILARMARGESAAKIYAAVLAMGVPNVSQRTVARRMVELRPELNAKRAPKAKSSRPSKAAPVASTTPEPGPPLPETPDEIPADASMALLEHYRRLARISVDAASDEGDLKLVAQLINMAGAVEDRIARRTPRPVEDPNDQPDMVALGKEVEERFVKMIDLVLEQR